MCGSSCCRSLHAWPVKTLTIDRGGRSRRQWARVDLDRAAPQAHPVGRELFGEWRRRATVLEPILEAMPRTGDAAVDDAAFANRAVLVGAKIGQRPDPRSVAKNRDALAARDRNDPRSLVRYGLRRAHKEPAVAAHSSALVDHPLTPGRQHMQHADRRQSPIRISRYKGVWL